MHRQKIKKNGQVHTKINAKELFGAIDEYKRNEGAYEGTIRDDTPRYVEEYEKGSTQCPVCNMDLIPVYKEKEPTELEDRQIVYTPEEYQNEGFVIADNEVEEVKEDKEDIKEEENV